MAAPGALKFLFGGLWIIFILWDVTCGVTETGETCGRPLHDEIHFSSDNFSVGQNTTIIDCGRARSPSKVISFRCIKETVQEAGKHKRGDYGKKWTDPNDMQKYLIHWVPKPDEAVCMAVNTAPSFGTGKIVAVVIGVALVISAVVIVVVCMIRNRKKNKRFEARRESRDSRLTASLRSDVR